MASVPSESPPAARQRRWPGRRKQQESQEPPKGTSETPQQQATEPATAPVTSENPPAARQRHWPGRRKQQESQEPPKGSPEAPQWQVPEPVVSKNPAAPRQLWGREFAVVREGLAQKQVESFVETLKAEYEARLKEKEESTAWDSFSKQILTEAEREASRIKLKAKQEAEIESSRMISEAKRDAQETMDRASRKAQDITEKQVQDILTAATKKAQLTETRARQLSQLMLIRAREDIQDHITGEVQSAYNKLNSMLEDLIGAARGIDGEWREKTLELWSSPALGTEEEQAALLGSGNIEALSGESVAPAPTEESAVLEEQTEESEAAVASQEPEVAEVSTSSQESDESSAELPIADVVQGESMEPSSTRESSLGEYGSEATQSAEAPAVEEATRENEQTPTILSSEPIGSGIRSCDRSSGRFWGRGRTYFPGGGGAPTRSA